MKTCMATMLLRILILAPLLSSALASECLAKCWDAAIADASCPEESSAIFHECTCTTFEKCVKDCSDDTASNFHPNLCDSMLAIRDSERVLKRDREARALNRRNLANDAAPVVEVRSVDFVADAASHGWANHCGYPGSACEVEERAVAGAASHGWENRCGYPGSFCYVEEG